MVGFKQQKKRWLLLLLCLLVFSSLLSACGGTTKPALVNPCATKGRVQNLTKQPSSTQTLYMNETSRLYALDARDGAERWCDQSVPDAFFNGSDPAFTQMSALVLDRTNLYAYTIDGLIAVDPTTGAFRWDSGMVGAIPSYTVNKAKPPIYDQMVYTSLDNYTHLSGIEALDEQDGRVRWRYNFSSKDFGKDLGINVSISAGSLPIVNNGVVYIEIHTDALVRNARGGSSVILGIIALDARHGNLKWSIELPDDDSGGLLSDLLVDQGKLFSSSLGQLYAVDAQTGKLVWKNKIDPNTEFLFGAGGLLYVGGEDAPTASGGRQARVYAVDMRTGNVLWADEADAYLLKGGNVYLLDEDGPFAENTGFDLVSVNPRTGKTLRSIHCPFATSDNIIDRAFTVINHEVYVVAFLPFPSKDFVVHAFSMLNGVEDWRATFLVDGDETPLSMVASQ